MRPVVILGFGRSGTTWLADIISRLLGRLVLFEPLHPSVIEKSEALSYRRVTARQDSLWLKQYILAVLEKRHRKPWLMRNHVPVRIEDINPAFLDYLWQECGIAGFKEIRLNLSIPWLVQQGLGSILFVIRDPRAVVASILNRPNFWEFGWPGTYDLIVSNVLNDPALAHHPVQRHADVMRSARFDIERIAILWALSHAIAIDDCEKYGIPIIRYEDLYRAPFDTVRQVIEACQLDPKPIHPSYVFSPSLTTNRTFHGIYSMDKKIERSDFSVFWERTLSAHQCAAITEIMHEFGLQYDLEEPGFIRPAWRRARETRAEELGLDRSRLVHEGAEAPRVKSAYG